MLQYTSDPALLVEYGCSMSVSHWSLHIHPCQPHKLGVSTPRKPSMTQSQKDCDTHRLVQTVLCWIEE